jgi:hypothetical protein
MPDASKLTPDQFKAPAKPPAPTTIEQEVRAHLDAAIDALTSGAQLEPADPAEAETDGARALRELGRILAEAIQERLGRQAELRCGWSCAAADLIYRADYAAPGRGQAWDCRACGRAWAKIGATFYPVEDEAHLMDGADA